MNVFVVCAYTRIAFFHLKKNICNNTIYGLARTWPEAVEVMLHIFSQTQSVHRPVVLYLSDELISSRIFELLPATTISYRKISELYGRRYPCNFAPLRSPPAPPCLTKKDRQFLSFMKHEMAHLNVSQNQSRSGPYLSLKSIYNRRVLLIKKLGIRNNNILTLLLPVLFAYTEHENSVPGTFSNPETHQQC